jgi:hypothetical protein
MSYLIIHRSSFLFRSAPIDERHPSSTLEFEKNESHFASVPLQPKELSYCCQMHISNKMFQGFHVSQLEKMSEDTAKLSSIEWSHRRQITLSTATNRVIGYRDHMMGHEMSRLYKLLRRWGEFPFQSSWPSILPLKFFVVSIPGFLLSSLLSNLGMRFSSRGENYNTPCYERLNQVN